MKYIYIAIVFVVLGTAGFIYKITSPQITTREAIASPLDINVLQQKVEHIVAYDDRSHENPNTLKKIAQDIQKEFKQYTKDVELQLVPVGGQEYFNVIAKFGPKADSKNKPIIIGAHYDTYKDLPGADDNASGVVGVLALAKLIAESNPLKPITLMAYVLEEPPYFASTAMGSAIHAQSLYEKGQSIELMISLEMIGYFTDEPTQNYPIAAMNMLYPKQGHFIAIVDEFGGSHGAAIKRVFNESTTLEARAINGFKSIRGVDFSDHRNYWAYDMPAVMITDTAFFRNQNYHKASDTPDTLNYEKMAETIWGVYLYLEAQHYVHMLPHTLIFD